MKGKDDKSPLNPELLYVECKASCAEARAPYLGDSDARTARLRCLCKCMQVRTTIPSADPQLRRLTAADVDFCVTLGGDGTVLHLASLFTEDAPLPPLASFAMGTLGFLTPFDAADFEACLQRVLSATELPVFCTLRTRKRCELSRRVVILLSIMQHLRLIMPALTCHKAGACRLATHLRQDYSTL